MTSSSEPDDSNRPAPSFSSNTPLTNLHGQRVRPITLHSRRRFSSQLSTLHFLAKRRAFLLRTPNSEFRIPHFVRSPLNSLPSTFSRSAALAVEPKTPRFEKVMANCQRAMTTLLTRSGKQTKTTEATTADDHWAGYRMREPDTDMVSWPIVEILWRQITRR